MAKDYCEHLGWEMKQVKFVGIKGIKDFLKKFKYPFKLNEVYLCLGEIKNMPGHYAYVEQKTGRVYWGYHSDTFEETVEDEDDELLNKLDKKQKKMTKRLMDVKA